MWCRIRAVGRYAISLSREAGHMVSESHVSLSTSSLHAHNQLHSLGHQTCTRQDNFCLGYMFRGFCFPFIGIFKEQAGCTPFFESMETKNNYLIAQIIWEQWRKENALSFLCLSHAPASHLFSEPHSACFFWYRYLRGADGSSQRGQEWNFWWTLHCSEAPLAQDKCSLMRISKRNSCLELCTVGRNPSSRCQCESIFEN